MNHKAEAEKLLRNLDSSNADWTQITVLQAIAHALLAIVEK